LTHSSRFHEGHVKRISKYSALVGIENTWIGTSYFARVPGKLNELIQTVAHTDVYTKYMTILGRTR